MTSDSEARNFLLDLPNPHLTRLWKYTKLAENKIKVQMQGPGGPLFPRGSTPLICTLPRRREVWDEVIFLHFCKSLGLDCCFFVCVAQSSFFWLTCLNYHVKLTVWWKIMQAIPMTPTKRLRKLSNAKKIVAFKNIDTVHSVHCILQLLLYRPIVVGPTTAYYCCYDCYFVT